MNKHMILIILDCLRQDYAYNPKYMPFLNKLKDDSISFKDAYAIAPATSFAMSSILTGKKPLEIENDWKITKKKQEYYLPKKFPNFYKTFITGNVMTCKKYGYSYGFDYFEDFLKKDILKRKKINKIFAKLNQKIKIPFINNLGKKIYYYIQNRILEDPNINVELKIRFPRIMDCFLKNLKPDKNTLSILHFIDPHAPYLSVNQKDQKIIKKTKKMIKKLYDSAYNGFKSNNLSEAERKFLLNRYEEEVKDLDNNLSKLIKEIKEKLDWNNTLLIITADHGEAFGETDYMTHPLYRVNNLHHIKIPLIFAGGLSKKIKISEKEMIWNIDLYDIMINIAEGKKCELDNNDLCVWGLKKIQDKWVICSENNIKEKKISETNKDLFDKNKLNYLKI